MTQDTATAAFAWDSVSKSFGRTLAVSDVSLSVLAGEALCLVGENGAGKSTLIRMAAGVIVPDSGVVRRSGEPVHFRSARSSIDHGIGSIFQELSLIDTLTVEQNLTLLDARRTPWRTVDRRAMRRRAREALDRWGLELDPAARVSSLPLGRKQMLEFVRVAQREPQVLLLDEATAVLGPPEVAWLEAHVRRIREAGGAVLFTSHRWDEARSFGTRIAVLRNGALVHEGPADIPEDLAVSLMAGSTQVKRERITVAPPADAPPALEVRGLRSSVLHDIDLEVAPGEVLGLNGLVGQGQRELLRAIFGAHRLGAGEVRVGRRASRRWSPLRAMRAGVAYVPAERKTEGLLLDKSVARNLTLAILTRMPWRAGVVDARHERDVVREAIARAVVRTTGPRESVGNLSGGNQQKVLLEKWLMTKPAVLLLDDVTRGVDIQTKRSIYRTIAEQAEAGVAIVMHSTDIDELLELAHRIAVMREGRVLATLAGDGMTKEGVLRAAVIAS